MKVALGVAIISAAAALHADQIKLQNGDHLSGKVLSMTADSVVLQNDVLGKVTVPRTKVGGIQFGTAPSVAPVPAKTNASGDTAEALRHLGADTNMVEQIRQQFLSDAGPEANAKFDDLIGGLMSGKMDINSLRKEAKSAADQIRTLKAQGNDMGGLLDSYVAILDSFLKESDVATSVPVTHTNYGTTIIR